RGRARGRGVFFFPAEDGIRAFHVTGVQTCALPIYLAYSWAGTFRHAWTLPTAVGLGMVCLLGGQLVLERALGFGGTLSTVIELAGGLFFLVLVLRKGAR